MNKSKIIRQIEKLAKNSDGDCTCNVFRLENPVLICQQATLACF